MILSGKPTFTFRLGLDKKNELLAMHKYFA
jgi:hypothetical protein